ncbi:MAG TPA: hypothetical protein GX743_02275 [Actinomycetales bacterium]|nr:hypothetical protein [Actinomycetales bacterium]
MSMPARATSTLHAPSPSQGRSPRLQIIRSPEPSRSLMPFFVLCALILLASLVGALLLNTAMAVSSYRIHDQQSRLTLLQEQQAELTGTLESLGSPAALRNSATSLGMVPAGATYYLSVASQSILGMPEPGEG